jgi:hypothetical protein
VSNAGAQITRLALPLTAALTLGATPAQMGLLAMAGSLPNLLFGLFAGVWVDRMRRQPMLYPVGSLTPWCGAARKTSATQSKAWQCVG